VELSRHVTRVGDATAARSRVALHAALGIDGPTYTHGFLTGRCGDQLSIGANTFNPAGGASDKTSPVRGQSRMFLLRRTLRTSSYSVPIT
jgi:hypothetical protein